MYEKTGIRVDQSYAVQLMQCFGFDTDETAHAGHLLENEDDTVLKVMLFSMFRLDLVEKVVVIHGHSPH